MYGAEVPKDESLLWQKLIPAMEGGLWMLELELLGERRPKDQMVGVVAAGDGDVVAERDGEAGERSSKSRRGILSCFRTPILSARPIVAGPCRPDGIVRPSFSCWDTRETRASGAGHPPVKPARITLSILSGSRRRAMREDTR